MGGEKRRATVYFCDLANFTSVSEKMAPEELVRHLADYFGAFSDDILAAGGTVDKYIGDAIMAFWGRRRSPPTTMRPPPASLRLAIRRPCGRSRERLRRGRQAAAVGTDRPAHG